MGTPEGKKALGGRRRRWKDIIKIDIREVGGELWTGLICLRRLGQLAIACERGNEPSGCIKCGEFLEWLRIGPASHEGLRSMELVSSYT
jgi:hypothetical protein